MNITDPRIWELPPEGRERAMQGWPQVLRERYLDISQEDCDSFRRARTDQCVGTELKRVFFVAPGKRRFVERAFMIINGMGPSR
jgi:hypothetical protein